MNKFKFYILTFCALQLCNQYAWDHNKQTVLNSHEEEYLRLKLIAHKNNLAQLDVVQQDPDLCYIVLAKHLKEIKRQQAYVAPATLFGVSFSLYKTFTDFNLARYRNSSEAREESMYIIAGICWYTVASIFAGIAINDVIETGTDVAIDNELIKQLDALHA